MRPATLVPGNSQLIASPLIVNEERFSQEELLKAIVRLKSGKAVKRGDIPAEALKALALEQGVAFDFWH